MQKREKKTTVYGRTGRSFNGLEPSSLYREGTVYTAGDSGFIEDPCKSIPIKSWNALLETPLQKQASSAIESGKILLLADLAFTLTHKEEMLVGSNPLAYTAPLIWSGHKQRLHGISPKDKNYLTAAALLKRYADGTFDLVARLFPGYAARLIPERTLLMRSDLTTSKSFRSERLLHIDAPASHPTQGRRILRIFTNIHPHRQPVRWRVGEDFSSLSARFAGRIKAPLLGAAPLLRMLGMTRKLRSPYDYYMQQLNQAMTRDRHYQEKGPQASVAFAFGSSWMVFSDQVPHAILSHGYCMQQTFLVPQEALDVPELSPLHALEKILRRKLL